MEQKAPGGGGDCGSFLPTMMGQQQQQAFRPVLEPSLQHNHQVLNRHSSVRDEYMDIRIHLPKYLLIFSMENIFGYSFVYYLW